MFASKVCWHGLVHDAVVLYEPQARLGQLLRVLQQAGVEISTHSIGHRMVERSGPRERTKTQERIEGGKRKEQALSDRQQ